MGLCKGRHPMPVNRYVFGKYVNLLDVKGLEKQAYAVIKQCVTSGICVVHIYFTGDTVALIAVMNVCRKSGVKINLWHYDKSTGTYYKQNVM